MRLAGSSKGSDSYSYKNSDEKHRLSSMNKDQLKKEFFKTKAEFEAKQDLIKDVKEHMKMFSHSPSKSRSRSGSGSSSKKIYITKNNSGSGSKSHRSGSS